MAISRQHETAFDLHDDREDLLSNVQMLKDRISLTERTLNSLSSPTTRRTGSRVSRRSSGSSPQDKQALTLAELHPTPIADKYSQYVSVPPDVTNTSTKFHFSKYKTGTDMTDSGPIVSSGLHFNTGSGDGSPADSIRSQLKSVQKENQLLIDERTKLLNKLDTAYSNLNQMNTAHASSSDEVSTYKRLISQLQESIICLQNEVKAQDKAIKKSEVRNDNSQVEINEGSKRLRQCSEMLKITEERMKEQQTLIKSLRLERDEALGKAEGLETELTRNKAAGSHSLLFLKDDLKKKDEEKKTLAQQNKEQRQRVISLERQLKVAESECDTIRRESSHLSAVNDSLTQQTKELKGRIHMLDSQITESRTVTSQNTQLNHNVSQLKQQLDEREKALVAELKHNEQFTKDIDQLENELKTKTSKLTTIQEQFGYMENGLLKQKQRINSLESELQQTDQIKMENIELRCQLEETQRKLGVCQQEIAVTSSQLSQLEDLASKIESRDKLSRSDSQSESSELRAELKYKTSEILQLQNTVEEIESKLRLTQLALDAKEKVHSKAEKIANDGEKSRLQSEVGRLKNKLSEGETRCNVLQSRLKELQSEQLATRKKLDTSQNNNKDLRQQKTAREAEIKTIKAKIAELEKSNRLHGTEMEEQCSIAERLQRKVTSLKKELAAKLTEEEQNIESMKLKSDQLQVHITEAQKQRDEYKTRLTNLQSEYKVTQEEIVNLETQLETEQKTVQRLQSELESSRNDVVTKKEELTAHVQACEERITELESSLSVSREECEALTNQIREEKTKYERQLDEKDMFIKEYQNRLKASQHSLQEVETELSKVKLQLQTNKQSDSHNSQQVSELQRQHKELKSQVSVQEQTLQRLNAAHQRELDMMKDKLQSTLEQLEQSKLSRQQAHDQLSDLEKDKGALLIEVESLESRLSHTQSSDKSRLEKLAQLEEELRETRTEINTRTEEINELESRLHKMEIDLEHQTLINTQFEGEFRRAQNDLKSAMSQMEEMQEILTLTREEKRSLELKLVDIEESLRLAQDELHDKNCEIEEMEHQIRSQEKQLLNRAQQVSQLDVTINSYRGEVETQLRQTAEQLRKCQQERDQKTQQASKLQEQITQISQDLKSSHQELSTSQFLVRKLESDLQDKSKHVCELESRLDNLEDKSEGLLHGLSTRSTEVTAKNDLIKRYEDQVERLQFELAESKIERQAILEKYNEAKQQLQEYLDTVFNLEQRLIQCEQNPKSTDTGLENAKHELQQLQIQHRKEIARLEEAQNDFMESKQDMESSYNSRVLEAENRERSLRTQLDMSHDQIQNLRAELSRRLELVKNANEAVVIKEAEIARLEAKVSGMERRWEGSSYHPHTSLDGTGDTKASIRRYVSTSGAMENIWREGDVDQSISSSLISPIKCKEAGSCNRNIRPPPSHTLSEDSVILRQRATRALFSPARPSQGHPSPVKSASFLDSLDLASRRSSDDPAVMLDTTDLHNTLYLRNTSSNHAEDTCTDHTIELTCDNTLAREREELFARLDELNKQPVQSLTSESVSQTVAHLIQSAARSDKENRPPSDKSKQEEPDSVTETLSTVRAMTAPDVVSSSHKSGNNAVKSSSSTLSQH